MKQNSRFLRIFIASLLLLGFSSCSSRPDRFALWKRIQEDRREGPDVCSGITARYCR